MGLGLCEWGCMGFFYSWSIDVVRVGICVRGGYRRFLSEVGVGLILNKNLNEMVCETIHPTYPPITVPLS